MGTSEENLLDKIMTSRFGVGLWKDAQLERRKPGEIKAMEVFGTIAFFTLQASHSLHPSRPSSLAPEMTRKNSD